MAAASPSLLHELGVDWRAVQQATQSRVSVRRNTSASSAWGLWSAFCSTIGADTELLPPDPVPILQIFAQRLRAGTLSPSGRCVKSRTVEDTLRGVGQTYASLGAVDPRLNAHGHIDFRLTSLYRSWATSDPPPSRVKPLPPSLLAQVITLAHQEQTPAALAAAEVLTLGFFFLLCPGEYPGQPNDLTDNLFRLRDVTFWVGARALDHMQCPVADLQAATFATLTFTRQKNGVRNETIGHGRSGHPFICPVLCLITRVLSLRSWQAPPSAAINAFRPAPGRQTTHVHARDLMRRMRNALTIFPDPSINPHDISARSTRSGGAMALLCAGVGANRIRLVGRWRSDELYRYLHVQAPQVMTGLSAAMLTGGPFQLAPK